ncbi:anti-sigma factor family protein [Chthonobacter rhizosphaerae]|uniref:anti-sigma factor family protein n=1 Tax=Chthonobacter rhizosphaerae TaxID=2735553 RepID=UPI0015EF4D0F|nr:anti-sigma factor [Chthonobacter rhizosphaerae]
MTRLHITNEILMAYADGEIDPQLAEAVDVELDRDPALVRRVAGFVRSRRLVRTAYLSEGLPPVPEALSRSIAEAVAASGRAAPASAAVVPLRRRTVPRALSAMAACLALVAAGAVGYALNTGRVADGGVSVAAELADPKIGEALDTVASGGETDLAAARFRAVSTFTTGSAGLCREFLVSGDSARTRAVACRQEGPWRVAFALAESGDGYQPAGTDAVVDAYLEASGAAAPLGEAEERKALQERRPAT